MHTSQLLSAVLLAALVPLVATGEEHVHGDKPATGAAPAQHEHSSTPKAASMMDRCQAMMVMHQKMAAEMKAADAELDQLLAEMNGATGDKKIEAMSALLNRLVQQRKTMHRKMDEMQAKMMHHMMEMSSGETSGSSGKSTPPSKSDAQSAEHHH